MRITGALLVALLISIDGPVHGFTSHSQRHALIQRPIVRPTTASTSWFLRSSSSQGNNGCDDTRNGNKKQNKSSRKKKKQKLYPRFATGNELKSLRADLVSLRENLQWAEAMQDYDRIADLQQALNNGERRDPDLVYAKALALIANTKDSDEFSDDEKETLMKKYQEDAQEAKACLPQFLLEGMWVGNYGDQGNELINVTYVGDTLIATKATGDINVPRGQVSFTCDLAPRNSSTGALEPLKLSFDTSSTAAKLPRFAGQGQIAKPGFIDPKYIDGQLVLFERHFSFVWLQTKHHVLFRRPSPEQTISMLRDVIAKEDELENMRDHLAKCFDMDMTESLARQHANEQQHVEPFRRISLQQDLEALETLEPKENARFNFWHVHKWFGGVLQDDSSPKEEQS